MFICSLGRCVIPGFRFWRITSVESPPPCFLTGLSRHPFGCSSVLLADHPFSPAMAWNCSINNSTSPPPLKLGALNCGELDEALKFSNACTRLSKRPTAAYNRSVLTDLGPQGISAFQPVCRSGRLSSFIRTTFVVA